MMKPLKIEMAGLRELYSELSVFLSSQVEFIERNLPHIKIFRRMYNYTKNTPTVSKFARELALAIRYDELPQEVEGYFDPSQQTIIINKDLDRSNRIFITLHEIAHYLQEEEGALQFLLMRRSQISKNKKTLNKLISYAKRRRKKYFQSRELSELFLTLMENYEVSLDLWQRMILISEIIANAFAVDFLSHRISYIYVPSSAAYYVPEVMAVTKALEKFYTELELTEQGVFEESAIKKAEKFAQALRLIGQLSEDQQNYLVERWLEIIKDFSGYTPADVLLEAARKDDPINFLREAEAYSEGLERLKDIFFASRMPFSL